MPLDDIIVPLPHSKEFTQILGGTMTAQRLNLRKSGTLTDDTGFKEQTVTSVTPAFPKG